MTADELATAVGTEAANELASALARIKHCLGQLSDEQVWCRSHPSLSSVGNFVLHLCGNLRQSIVAGLGGAAGVRDRPPSLQSVARSPGTSCCAGWRPWWTSPGRYWHGRLLGNCWRPGASRAST